MRKVYFLSRNFTELTGVIHNHSNHSYDCDMKLNSIIDAAYRNRIDYLTINDHNTLPPRKEVDEALKEYKEKKKYEPIVIIGAELNDSEDHHHLLVFNGTIPAENLPIESIIAEQKKSNAYTFAAHPYENRISKRFPLYIWDKKELLQEVCGMEIWNYASTWLSKLNPKMNGLFLVLFPNLFVRKPFPENLKLWDELNINGYKIAAIGSTDAHSTEHKVLFFKIRILSHRKLFETIRTNVLLPEEIAPSEDAILQALKKGNSYIVNYHIGYPYNFWAGICQEKEPGATFGEEIKYEPGLRFYYRLSRMCQIALIKDGSIISHQNELYGYFPIEAPGNYRLEILKFGAGWIYTNNIYVLK